MAYDKLMEKSKELLLLQTVGGIVHWDLETYMPPSGIMLRSEQLSLLEKIGHRMQTNPEIGDLLKEAEKDDSLDDLQKRNLFLFRREYDQATKIPEELVAKLAKQQAITVNTWRKAKAENDWKTFKPELQKMVDLSVERAEIVREVKGIDNLYDSMLDDFERGLTADTVTKVFSELRDGLVPLVEKIGAESEKVDTKFLKSDIPIETQRKIAEDLCELIGYDISSDKARGRIDEVEHPFTTGYYDDVRITVHYYKDNMPSMFYAIMHEGGHALYEQNLNKDWMFQPVGVAASFGIHESQARFIENMIGRSPEFLKFYLPRLNKFTGGAYSDIEFSDFLKAMNIVRPSLIRIEADEVTYSLHVIIRFEIERDLFSGKITVSELPEVWNQKYEEYLGVEVPDYAKGVMQDTHWASGYYGYFPSYALGNIYDGMWLDMLNKEAPDWLDDVSKGKLSTAIGWLKENVHVHSAKYDPANLVKHVTGMSMTAKPFLKYLDEKYSTIFGI